jgi:uncharacterized membrane protein YgcG
LIRYILIGTLLILSLQPWSVLAQGTEPPIPAPPTGGNVVLDRLDWLTSAQESEINSINRKLDDEGIAQIAVVTLDDCGEDKQRFRNDLFRTWGVGHANDNDGLLILVCWYGGDPARRSLEQETGYGLEGTLPDILTGRVVDEIFIPAFQTDRPGEGLVRMVREYDRILRDEPQSQITPEGSDQINIPLVWLITALLGSVPGLILSTIFVNLWRSERRFIPPSEVELWEGMEYGRYERYERSPRGLILPNIRQIASAEIISLFPILGLIYISLSFLSLPPDFRAYGPIVGENLFYWLIVLFFFNSQGLYGGRGGYGTGGWGRSRGGWSSSRGSFGGGRSGGGGSSKKF